MSGHLHAADIAFRDLKPENILFGMDGHIRLTGANLCTNQKETMAFILMCPDFGLAKPQISKTMGDVMVGGIRSCCLTVSQRFVLLQREDSI